MQQQPIVAADVLEALLLALGTADTAVIGQAEADLRRALTKPAFIGDLLDRLQRSPNAQVRQLAAVLMRRKVGGHWSKLPPPVQAQLKASLLTHLAAEPERLVRRATAGVAAVVAKHTLPKGEWAELLAFVTACAADAADAGKRELAMVLLQSLLESEVVVECAPRARFAAIRTAIPSACGRATDDAAHLEFTTPPSPPQDHARALRLIAAAPPHRPRRAARPRRARRARRRRVVGVHALRRG